MLIFSYRSAQSTNMPLPFAMPGTENVFVELWFHASDRSISEECKKRKPLEGTPMMFQNLDIQEVKADPLVMTVQVLDPYGNVR